MVLVPRTYARCRSRLVTLTTLVWFAGALAVPLHATALLQSVTLEGSTVTAGARPLPWTMVTVREANNPTIVRVTRANEHGVFAIESLPPGQYVVTAEHEAFAAVTQTITVTNASLQPIRLTLDIASYRDAVVVTASRIETPVAETTQTIERVGKEDLQRAVAGDLTDLLKKNSGVDVIQYTGALSGIGVRGFRPQFSGINKRSLLLVDGRPAGLTNLATLLLDDVEGVEVLKGAASAAYGASAMGGVVNVLTRRSTGPLTGRLRVGAGSFSTRQVAGRIGGSLSSRLDIDVSGSAFEQGDDLRMGNGVVRPATSFRTHAGSVRAGVTLPNAWRIDARANAYRGRDIMTPGDLFAGASAQGQKDLEQSSQEVRAAHATATHDVVAVAYHASEAGHTANVTSANPIDVPFLPYLSFETQTAWSGLQGRDAWTISPRFNLLMGVDLEHVRHDTRSYARTGDRVAPFSADSAKRTVGAYGQQTLLLRDGRTIITAGARVDLIATETRRTPLKSNFTPSTAETTVLTPSAGITHRVTSSLRLRGTVGRAFIPAEASMLTGHTVGTVGERTQVTQGNPDLRPERSTSIDVGASWTTGRIALDVTYFVTHVRDRFISNVVVSNPAPPDPLVVSVINGLDAQIQGVDLDMERRLSPVLTAFANATHYFRRRERLASDTTQTILNVPRTTVRAGVDVTLPRASARVAGRWVQGRFDNDFNAPGFPIVRYDDFVVLDASARLPLTSRHAVLLTINNLFDSYYYEKLGFPLEGTSFRVAYELGF